MKVRAELHCHTFYSSDSSISFAEIIESCQKERIETIAITDHNQIEGALKLSEIAPPWLNVIIGEEIRTRQGEITGLYLNSRIEPDQDIESTLEIIKYQGGLVLLPHPFDRIRKEASKPATVDKIKDKIDCLEIFNSRCLFSSDNQKALKYAQKHRLLPYAGSDAHTQAEIGRASCYLNVPKEKIACLRHDSRLFLDSLKGAEIITRRSGPGVHFLSKWIKLRKALQGKLGQPGKL